MWDNDLAGQPQEPPKEVQKNEGQPKGGNGKGTADKQEPEKYGKYGNPGGKAETRDEARRMLGDANSAYSKIQGSVQRLQKELKEGESSIARMVADVLAKRQKMQEKHVEVMEEMAKLDEAKNRRRTIEDKEHEACVELNVELAKNLEPSKFANLGKATDESNSMDVDKWFGLKRGNSTTGTEGRSAESSGEKYATGTPSVVKAEEAASVVRTAVGTTVEDKPALVAGSKPTVSTEDAKPEIIEEDNRIGHGGADAAEGGGDSEMESDSDDGTQGEHTQGDEESQAGDREIDSKEAWTDAMVDFIWQAKDASELPAQCPELANWLNVWNDAENETGKQTAKDLLEVVQKGIEAMAEKRNQDYFDMQKVGQTAAGGNLEAAEKEFQMVGAYADTLRTHFSEWIRSEITHKLDTLAGTREAAVTDGTATSHSVKIAKKKLRAHAPKTGGKKKGRKSVEDGRSTIRKKYDKSKKKKPPGKADDDEEK